MPGAYREAWASVAGNRNLIRDNHASGRDGGNLVLLAGSDNALIGNEAFGGVTSLMAGGADFEGDGIFVGAFTAGTLLRDNVAHDNAGDGIEVRGAASRLADNVANDNGDWGIDAAAGVTDLGGNSASGNGQAAQCRNLFCG